MAFDDSAQSISHCSGCYLGGKQAAAVQSTCQNIEVLPQIILRRIRAEKAIGWLGVVPISLGSAACFVIFSALPFPQNCLRSEVEEQKKRGGEGNKKRQRLRRFIF